MTIEIDLAVGYYRTASSRRGAGGEGGVGGGFVRWAWRDYAAYSYSQGRLRGAVR